MKLDRIAVAIDFSESSLAALRRAGSLAQQGATIQLIHAIDPRGDPIVLGNLYAELERAALKELELLADEPRKRKLVVDVTVRVGRAADEILNAAAGADLIVAGTHGRGVLGRLMLGSVAEELARRSPAPVLIVHGDERPIERILLAVDPSGPSRDAVIAGAALARQLGARLEAIHAVHLPTVLPYADKGALLKMNQVLEAQLQSSPVLVRELVERETGMKDVRVYVVSGSPAHEVQKHARPGDIVVCGTHGRSAFGRFVFGSVAAKLIRALEVPVLVVRPAEDEAA